MKEKTIKQDKRVPEWITECLFLLGFHFQFKNTEGLIDHPVINQNGHCGLFFSKDTLKSLTSIPKSAGIFICIWLTDTVIFIQSMSHGDGTWTAAELIENKAKNVVLGFMNCVIKKIWFIVLESLSFYHHHLSHYWRLF